MTASTRKTVLVTNNGADYVLLVDGDTVLSAWMADPRTMRAYLRDGVDAAEWEVDEWPRLQDSGDATIDGWGKVVGERGTIDDESRRDYWVSVLGRDAVIGLLLDSCYAEAVREGFTGARSDWHATEADLEWVADWLCMVVEDVSEL